VGDGRSEAQPTARVGRAAVLLATSMLLSRILGYAREAVLAYRVGAGAQTDAYYAAFQIPDLLNYLLAGGALSIAFVPLYTQQLARDDAAAAEHLFATVLGGLGVVALTATALLWWFAEPLVAVQFPRFDPATQALTAHLTRIVLPAQVFFIVGGIVNGTLLARNRFGPTAAAPLLYNGAIIVGGVFLAPHFDLSVEGFAWGALAGAVLGPFLAPLLDARGRVRLRIRVAFTDRTFLNYLVVAAPLMLGQTLLTVDEWYGRWFGALLGTGTVAHLGYARRLMLVPVAVVGQAIAAAALPTLSRLWAEKRRDELDRIVLRTLQAGVVLGMCAAAACVVLARPLVQVFYQHGAFTADDSTSVAAILAILALSVPAWVVQQIAARAFYARGDTLRPMLLGTGVALAAIPLYLVFGRQMGVLGLAAAGSLGMTINAVATLALARWLHGGPRLGDLLRSAGRALLIAAGPAIAVALLPMEVHSMRQATISLLCRSLLFTVLVTVGIFKFGDQPVRQVLQQTLRRRWNRRG